MFPFFSTLRKFASGIMSAVANLGGGADAFSFMDSTPSTTKKSKKKTTFWSKFYKKCPKTGIIDVFVRKLACGVKCLVSVLTVFWERSENQFGRPLKKAKKNLSR